MLNATKMLFTITKRDIKFVENLLSPSSLVHGITSVYTPVYQCKYQQISTHTSTSIHIPVYQYTHQYISTHTRISVHIPVYQDGGSRGVTEH